MSPLGERVADLLGELFQGIYHIDSKALHKVDWSNPYWIRLSLGWKSLSTFDFVGLTYLVFLAHWMCIRVEVSPCNFHHLEIMFHPRKRNGDYSERHPTIDEALNEFKKQMLFDGIDEFQG